MVTSDEKGRKRGKIEAGEGRCKLPGMRQAQGRVIQHTDKIFNNSKWRVTFKIA